MDAERTLRISARKTLKRIPRRQPRKILLQNPRMVSRKSRKTQKLRGPWMKKTPGPKMSSKKDQPKELKARRPLTTRIPLKQRTKKTNDRKIRYNPRFVPS